MSESGLTDREHDQAGGSDAGESELIGIAKVF